MKKNKLVILIFILTFFILLPNCGKRNNVTVIKLAHALDINHPVHKAMEYMAERLVEKSNGEMKIQMMNNKVTMEITFPKASRHPISTTITSTIPMTISSWLINPR